MHEEIVSSYLHALLETSPEDASRAEPAASSDQDPRYILVQIGGLRLLIPPGHGVLVQETCSSDTTLRVTDVRPALFPQGHPALARPSSPKCWLVLRSKALQMWFETHAERVDIDPDSVTWRVETATRPWLRGTVADLKAAIIDPEMLAAAAGELDSGANDEF